MDLQQAESKILFKVTKGDIQKYIEKPVYIGIPRMVAYYEYNHEKLTKVKRMRYLKLPKIHQYPLCLNGDLESYVVRSRTANFKNIDAVLKYVSSPAFNSGCGNVDKIKVITRCGTLIYLMGIYQNKKMDARKIKVSRFNNNLYMLVERNDEICKLGHSNTHHLHFDRMLFVDSPNATPDVTIPCDENVMLIGVHRSNFGKFELIYSKDFQGIMDEEAITDFDDIDEIADRRFVLAKQMYESSKSSDPKHLRIWLQSYLGNIRDIFIGLKNKKGYIEEPLKRISVKDIPNNRYWKPSICTGFLYHFLKNVENIMSSVNCPKTVYEFSFDAQSCYFTYKIFHGKSEKTFIPEEYEKFCHGL